MIEMISRRWKRYRMARWGALLVCAKLALSAGAALAGVPLVSSVEVSDLTTGSFAVTWQSSEPASGTLYLFQADCLTPVPDPVLVPEASERTGLIRVSASDLAANTTYCYQTATTSTSSLETTVYPLHPVPVTTQKTVTRELAAGQQQAVFANDLVQLPEPYLASQTDTQDGVLVLLRFPDGKADRPLSLLLSSDTSRNYFNLNNLFDPGTGQSLNLTGGERVRISERHGLAGCSALDRFRTVPADQEQTRAVALARCARSGDLDCNARVDILDVLRLAHGGGTVQGDPCFNGDLDVNGDGKVDQLDLDAVTGGFDATP